MLIKCNCLIAKCWETILRGFQWNYLISSQEVCRRRKRAGAKSEGGKGSGAKESKQKRCGGVFIYLLNFLVCLLFPPPLQYAPHEVLILVYI